MLDIIKHKMLKENVTLLTFIAIYLKKNHFFYYLATFYSYFLRFSYDTEMTTRWWSSLLEPFLMVESEKYVPDVEFIFYEKKGDTSMI